MRIPIVALRDKRADYGQHAGLLLQRYLCENATGEGGNPEEKKAILRAAIKATEDAELRTLYQAAYKRRHDSLPGDSAQVVLATPERSSRLIVGLGLENVLEAGIRLHHNYGLPIIPGSALKGLATHYCDQVWGPTDEKFKKGATYHQPQQRESLALHCAPQCFSLFSHLGTHQVVVVSKGNELEHYGTAQTRSIE